MKLVRINKANAAPQSGAHGSGLSSDEMVPKIPVTNRISGTACSIATGDCSQPVHLVWHKNCVSLRTHSCRSNYMESSALVERLQHPV